MEMRAYPSDYLTSAQRILGDMLDFAVNMCDMDIDDYFELFTISSVSTQFQNGNPTYIAGKNGCELVREVIANAGMEPLSVKDEMYLDKSPEYWAGWALAYYQWYTCRPFIKIHKAVTLKKILSMYEVYHEKDVEVVSVSLDDNKEAWEKAYKEENIPWIDGSNLLGWKDPVALWYAIRGIPHKVLVDQHGIIVASGFHQLGSLEYQINKYLNSHKD